MKKYFLLAFCSIVLCSLHAQIKISSTGKVGINNTNPTYQLDVTGDFRISPSSNAVICNDGYFYPSGDVSLGTSSQRWTDIYADYPTFTSSPVIDSDVSLKTDISDFSEMSGQLNRLRAVKYKLKSETVDGRTYYGFIAQEVKEIFPDIVVKREDGTYGIRYMELIPVMVKAIQEQQKVIEDLESRLKVLESAKQ
jgi:hypothetical protein